MPPAPGINTAHRLTPDLSWSEANRMKAILAENWERSVNGRKRNMVAAALALAIVGAPFPMAVFGQPLDAVVGWHGLAFLVIGLFVAVWGLLKVGTKAGRIVLATGAGLVVFM